MTPKEKFNDTVNILVQAYLNDTLVHGYPCGCAVGNLVASKCGITFKYGTWAEKSPQWNNVFMTSSRGQRIYEHSYEGEARRQIDATGYAWQDLAKIEFAFESAPKGKSRDEWMFNGLMAVVDVLQEIHGMTPEEATAAKELFVKA